MALNPNEELLEKDLFVEPPDQDLVCPICLCIFKDAQQLRICNHMFCKQCITTYFESVPATNFCPIDKIPASIVDVVPAARAIVNIIGRLQLKCFYNREGCPNIESVENLLERHAKVCTKRPCGPRISIGAPHTDTRNVRAGDGVPINLYVKLASPAKTIVVTITTDATVRDLKQRVHEKDGIAINMRLIKGTKSLEDHQVLSHYRILNNDVIFQVANFEGGAHL